jgi:tripartite-type tricarboxylate transporter receptor subunit TctC
MYTTAGTLKSVVDRLSSALVRTVEAPPSKTKFEAIGLDVRSSTPEQPATFAASGTTRWNDIIKALNIRLN